MQGREFELQPFAPERAPEIRITGDVSCNRNSLIITYHLHDPQSLVVLPTLAEHPERRDGLWESTCFEFFLGPLGQERYWEVNASAAGHWNCYRFAAYRRGMVPEGAIAQVPVDWVPVDFAEETDLSLALAVGLDLEAIGLLEQPLQLGVTAVILDRRGALSYWALAHTGPEADFHRRDSFVMELA